jgi:t-SNARE complex subunit (syntaxin)
MNNNKFENTHKKKLSQNQKKNAREAGKNKTINLCIMHIIIIIVIRIFEWVFKVVELSLGDSSTKKNN